MAVGSASPARWAQPSLVPSERPRPASGELPEEASNGLVMTLILSFMCSNCEDGIARMPHGPNAFRMTVLSRERARNHLSRSRIHPVTHSAQVCDLHHIPVRRLGVDEGRFHRVSLLGRQGMVAMKPAAAFAPSALAMDGSTRRFDGGRATREPWRALRVCSSIAGDDDISLTHRDSSMHPAGVSPRELSGDRTGAGLRARGQGPSR